MTAAMLAIPKTLHFIWISARGKKAKALPKSFYKNVLETLDKANHGDWEVNLWVDKKTSKLPKIKQLKAKGFILKNSKDAFKTMKDESDEDKLTNTEYKNIFNKSYNLAIKIDVLKYQILKKHGGIVNDFNFIYNRLPDVKELYSYDLILYKATPELSKSSEHSQERLIENGFLASTANHKFFKELTKKITLKAVAEGYCLDKNPKLPQEISDSIREKNIQVIASLIRNNQIDIESTEYWQLLAGLTSTSEKNTAKSYCSTDIATKPLWEMELSKYTNIHINEVIVDFDISSFECVSNPCFGYDSSDKTTDSQSWLE